MCNVLRCVYVSAYTKFEILCILFPRMCLDSALWDCYRCMYTYYYSEVVVHQSVCNDSSCSVGVQCLVHIEGVSQLSICVVAMTMLFILV